MMTFGSQCIESQKRFEGGGGTGGWWSSGYRRNETRICMFDWLSEWRKVKSLKMVVAEGRIGVT